ncbi:MAG: M56 family metallopeptidase [Clostridiales bacterium]|nr:M56 family metallopeptidase [Clostridiales bacterium]
MAYWLQMLLGCTLSMGAVTCLMAALAPVISRRYSQRTVYALLTVVLLGFLIPWRPALPQPAVQIALPAYSPSQAVPHTAAPAAFQATDMQTEAPAVPAQTGAAAAAFPQSAAQTAEAPAHRLDISWTQASFLVWAAGTAVMLAKEGWRHRRFMRLVNRWAVPAPVYAQELLAQVAQGRRMPALLTCPAIDSPMVTGVFRPRLLLPQGHASDDDLLLMFRHEWTHFRRGDVAVKLLIVVAKAIHWMNPAVYLLSREMNLYCETSCDEAVLAGCGKMERRRYAETVMSVMTRSDLRQTALCTGFQGGLKRTKRRILHMLDTRNKKNGVLLLVAVLMLSILSGAALAVGPETTAEPENALQLPLSNEIDCSLLTFEYSFPAILHSDAYGCIPVYPFYDDPTYPGALYSPGVPVAITGSVWRDEPFRGVSGGMGMRYLQAIIKLGEHIDMVYIPEMFVQLVEEYPDCALPTATVVADEGQQHANLYEKMYTDAPSGILTGGSQAEIISLNEDWIQVRQGHTTGYVHAENLLLDAETAKAFQPGFLEGYTDAPGYAYRSNAYHDWFNSMVLQYGYHDYWDMEQLALMSEVKERYGQYDAGTTVYVLPGENDFTKEEAIARAFSYLDEGVALEDFGVRVELCDQGGNKEYAVWRISFLNPEKRDQSRLVIMNRDGSLAGKTTLHPTLDAAVIAKYGPAAANWPMEYRKALYPQDWALDHAVTLSDGTVVYVNYKQWSTSVQPDDFPCSMAEAIEKTIETISAGEGQDMRAQLLSDAFIINVKVQEVNDWEEGVHMGKYWQWNVRFSAPYEQQPYQYQVSINAETGEAQAFFDPREVFRTQVDWQENHNGNG